MNKMPSPSGSKRPRSERELLEIRVLDVEELPKGEYGLDPDTLDCPICREPLCPPVFQCGNGHHLCSSCCEKLEKCPSCAQPIELASRCLGMEKILESLEVRCKHALYGCTEFLKFIARKEHEQDICAHRPFPCPVPECTYKGPKPLLTLHMENAHHVQTVHFDSSRKVRFTMKPTDDFLLLKIGFELFIIHHEIVEPSFGDIFFCSSFGGIPDKQYYLKIEVKDEGKYYCMRTGVPNIGQPEEWKTDFLLVPCAKTMPRAINCEFALVFTE